MNRQQRREFFERLCAMRDGYGQRGAADKTSVISIDAMIVRASGRLNRPRATIVIERDEAASA